MLRLLLILLLALPLACNESGVLDDDDAAGDDDDISGDDDDATGDDDDATGDDDDATGDDDDATGDDDDGTGDDDDATGDDDDATGDDDDATGDDDDATTTPCGNGTLAGSFQPNTAAEVATFCADGYGTIDGDLTISSFTLDSVADLGCLCAVTGDLIVGPTLPLLTDLTGLENLAFVGGDVTFSWVSQALGLGGLDGLQEVGGTFAIQNSSGLTDLTGAFPGLESVDGDMTFASNGFQNVAAFNALETVGGDISFTWHGALPDVVGFGALTLVEGSVSFANNGSLASVSGFGGGTDFVIEGDLSVASNGGSGGALSGFGNLAELGGGLSLSWNTGFNAVSGFGVLEEIGGSLQITNTSGVAAISGFTGLEEIGDDLQLSSNTNLTDLSGLMGVEEVDGDLTITWNAQLPTATAEALRDAIGTSNIGGSVTIANNQ